MGKNALKSYFSKKPQAAQINAEKAHKIHISIHIFIQLSLPWGKRNFSSGVQLA
jgi:hypothetical protein